MKFLFNKILLSTIIFFSVVHHLNAQSNENLKKFRKIDYDMLKVGFFGDIDFHIANEITLYRELRSEEKKVLNGILKIINNTRYEYIFLPKQNIGRYFSTSGYDNLQISFDSRHPEKTFSFEMKKTEDGDYIFSIATSSQNNKIAVLYAGELFFLQVDSSLNSNIMNSTSLLFENINENNEETIKDTLKSFPTRRKN